MTQALLNAFLLDLQGINAGIHFDDGWFHRASPITGLVAHLRATVAAPAEMTVHMALNRTADPSNGRLEQYRPAIERLCQVWGRGAHRTYPDQLRPTTTYADRAIARNRFAILSQNIPLQYRPNDFNAFSNHDMDAFSYRVGQGPAYLRRVQIDGQNVDITARSLFLCAGLLPPDPISNDHSYANKLDLTENQLAAMAGRSILDIGCGAAMFGAEMAALYNCDYNMVDLSSNIILLAMRNAKRRYASSMMYMQMLADESMLGIADTDAARAPLIERCITSCADIFARYTYNPPRPGNIFDLAPIRQNLRPGGWDYAVSMFLFCYFDAQQQADAIIQLCRVTNRRVMIFNGLGLVRSERFVYDRAAVEAAVPNVNIEIKSEKLHYFHLP